VKILGIETATAVCAAAVSVDGSVKAEAWLEQQFIHAEKLLSLVQKAMSDARLTLAEMDGIAVSIGPGSFTGLRIGLSAAKGMVYATGLPLLAVPTLGALARSAVMGGSVSPRSDILAIIDARRNDVYCQLFASDGRPLGEAKDRLLHDLVADIAGRRVTVTGDAVEKVAAYLRTLENAGGVDAAFLDHDRARASAGSVALVGGELLAEGTVEDPSLLEPRYIKEFFLKTR